MHEARGGTAGIAGQPQRSRRITPAAGEKRADGGERAAVLAGDSIDDFVEGPVSAHGDDQLRARRHRGRRQNPAVAGSARLHLIARQAETAQAVAKIRPETRGTPAARDGIDDGERARQSRPPPIARRKSVMDGKRIIGFPRFSSPMVVWEPP